MSSDELLSTALRVMGRHMDHREPDPEDVQALRDAVPAETARNQPIDVLAGQMIDEQLKEAKKPSKTIEEVESGRAL